MKVNILLQNSYHRGSYCHGLLPRTFHVFSLQHHSLYHHPSHCPQPQPRHLSGAIVIGSRLLDQTSSRSLSLYSLCIVEVVRAARKIPDSSTPRFTEMTLTGRVISYYGTVFHWANVLHTLLPQEWPANVSDLRLLPMERLVNYEEISRSLRERGLKYWQMQGQHLKEYVGNKPEDASDVSNLILLRGGQRGASSHILCLDYQIAKTRQAGFKLSSSLRSLRK